MGTNSSDTTPDTIDLHEKGADTNQENVVTEQVVALHPEDVAALKQLVGRDDRGDRLEFTRSLTDEGQFKIGAKHYVGSIGLPNRVIRIHPKVSDRILARILAYTGESDAEFLPESTTLEEGFSFIDALAKQFVTEVDTIIRQGLRRSYQQVTEARSTVRGQIDVQRQLQRQPPIPTKFECSFNEFTHDTFENRALLRATAIAAGLVTVGSVRRDLRRVQTELERRNVSRVPITGSDFAAHSLSRLEAYYEPAMALAQTIIEGDFIQHTSDESVPIKSFLVDMNNLFERLVRQLARDTYERQDPAYRVTKETIGHFVKQLPENTGFGQSLPPDVVVSKSKHYEAVMDAKWTMKGPQMDHFYQMVAYMTVANVDDGILVYPALTEETQQFHTKAGKQIVAVAIPVEEIREYSQPAFENTLQRIFEQRLADVGIEVPASANDRS